MQERRAVFELLTDSEVYYRLLDVCGGIPANEEQQRRSLFLLGDDFVVTVAHSFNSFTLAPELLDSPTEFSNPDGSHVPIFLEALQPLSEGKELTARPFIAVSGIILRDMPTFHNGETILSQTGVIRSITLYEGKVGGCERWEARKRSGSNEKILRFKPFRTELPKKFWSNVLAAATYIP